MKVEQLHIGSGHQVGPFTLFPVWAEGTSSVSLATGISADLAVAELSAGPQVNRLAVTNNGTKPAMLLEGELLEGGHQHRVSARDVVIAPGESCEVETVCVEQGRWGGSARHSHSGRRAPLNVRVELNRGAADARQQDRIWRRVDRFQGMNAVSATRSLVDHINARQRSAQLSVPDPIDGQRGVIVGLGGRALMLELFGSHRLFVQHYAAIVEAAMLDIQLAGGVAAVLTPAQSARDLAVHVMKLGLAAQGGPVAINGVTYTQPGSQPALVHLTGWDTRHPLMAG
ncbi:ARPP-1 family domain-containing protein [Arthrobacter zhaoguopingii]|uniref:ARPP-1 family domain-containing protein n=1 Tax=Arthrobacter zhaoguopingii TaxID=2681491 RepID=UPI001357C5A0|nr:DUF6569 family protein [Arthrobacter zhaoguopingii]